MLLRQETLLDPPFAKDPPVKLNIPAKTLGLIYAILSGIAALFGLFGLLALFGLSGVAAVAGVGGFFILGLLGAIVGWVATIAIAWGGYQMYQGRRDGRRFVIHGLAASVVGNLVGSIGGVGDLIGWMVGTAITFVLYYLVVISRFPDEPLLVATAR